MKRKIYKITIAGLIFFSFSSLVSCYKNSNEDFFLVPFNSDTKFTIVYGEDCASSIDIAKGTLQLPSNGILVIKDKCGYEVDGGYYFLIDESGKRRKICLPPNYKMNSYTLLGETAGYINGNSGFEFRYIDFRIVDKDSVSNKPDLYLEQDERFDSLTYALVKKCRDKVL